MFNPHAKFEVSGLTVPEIQRKSQNFKSRSHIYTEIAISGLEWGIENLFLREMCKSGVRFCVKFSGSSNSPK